jgi:hypothetical protein
LNYWQYLLAYSLYFKMQGHAMACPCIVILVTPASEPRSTARFERASVTDRE